MSVTDLFKEIDLSVEAPLMKVKYAGQECTVVFDFAAIKRAEEKLDIDLMDISVWPKLKIDQIATALWCGLATNHPDVLIEEVRKMVNGRNKWLLKGAMFDQFFPGEIQRRLDSLQQKASELPNVEAPAVAEV